MNSVSEAINTLISAANVAHGKGVYSLEESHYIYLAINYLNQLSQEENSAPAPQPNTQPSPQQEFVEQKESGSGDQTSQY